MIVCVVMKHHYLSSLFTFILISAACSLSAQNKALKLGIKGGLNLSYLSIGNLALSVEYRF
jgi:hypothetical protein